MTTHLNTSIEKVVLALAATVTLLAAGCHLSVSEQDAEKLSEIKKRQLSTEPASGKLGGRAFEPDKAHFDRGMLTLRQDDGLFPRLAVEVTLHLANDAVLCGSAAYVINQNRSAADTPFGSSTPDVELRWNDDGEEDVDAGSQEHSETIAHGRARRTSQRTR